MNQLPRQLFALSLAVLLYVAAASAERRPMQPLDVLHLSELDSFKVSPDGKWLLYAKSVLDWKAGRRFRDLYVVGIDGNDRRRMTFTDDKDEMSFEWSRDSSAFAFLSDRSGSRQIYWLVLNGGEARQLTNERDRIGTYHISRDGRWLAYQSGPSDSRQLKIIDLNSEKQEPAALTKHKTAVDQWIWLPDSSGILFTAADDDESLLTKRSRAGFDMRVNAESRSARNLWSIDIESKKEERLTSHNGASVTQPEVSPDGRQVAYKAWSTGRYADKWDAEIYLLTIGGGEPRRITHNQQPEEEYQFSPDSRWLAYIRPDPAEEFRAKKIFIVPSGGSESKMLLAGWKYDGGLSFWSPDSRAIYFDSMIGTNDQIHRASIDGGEPEQVTTGNHVLTIQRDPDSGTILFTRTAPEHPKELFTAPLGAIGNRQAWTRLTDFSSEIEPFQLTEYETIRWTSTDGKSVEGVLAKPIGYEAGKRYPLVVQVHGGPAGTSSNAFSGDHRNYVHVLAGRGYAVFQPNYRGSTGYGEEFRGEIAGDYFRQGFDDIMSGVDYLIAEGIADPGKLIQMGWSAGGHWSNWALTHTDRFKAISSGAGAVNWVSMWAQSDMQVNREHYFEGKPYENFEHYIEVSPITYIKNAKTPTLIMCGMNDPRVPSPQSRELYMSLQSLGVPVEYIEFPGEGHGLEKPRYQLVKMEAELAWFDKWLNGKTEWLDWQKLIDTVNGPARTTADAATE